MIAILHRIERVTTKYGEVYWVGELTCDGTKLCDTMEWGRAYLDDPYTPDMYRKMALPKGRYKLCRATAWDCMCNQTIILGDSDTPPNEKVGNMNRATISYLKSRYMTCIDHLPKFLIDNDWTQIGLHSGKNPFSNSVGCILLGNLSSDKKDLVDSDRVSSEALKFLSVNNVNELLIDSSEMEQLPDFHNKLHPEEYSDEGIYASLSSRGFDKVEKIPTESVADWKPIQSLSELEYTLECIHNSQAWKSLM